jgi:GAF domain-containing protein
VTGERADAVRRDDLDDLLLDALVRHSAVAFVLYDAQLRCRRISHALAALEFVRVDECVGRRPTEFLPKGVGDGIEEALIRVLADGETFVERAVARGTRGAELERHEDRQWIPLRDARDTPVGVLLVVDDVTDDHAHAERLRTSQWRGSQLRRAIAEFAGALTLTQVAAAVADIGRMIGADGAELRLLDDAPGRPPRPHVPGQRSPWGVLGEAAHWPDPLGGVLLDGTARYVPDTGGRPDEDAVGVRAWAALPVSAGHGLLGVLRFTYGRPRAFGPEDRAFFATLSSQCGVAVERARLHERERAQIVSLQRALLPAELPTLPGVRVAFRYLAGVSDTEVGGDWYDAFAFDDGRIGLVVGDVIGKGLGAAAGMGRVRTALRALAFTDPRPREVIAGLDRLFAATESDESLTTVVYAVVDPGRHRLVLAEAGHLPLLVVSTDGSTRYEDAGPASTPLGWSEPRSDREIQLAVGDVVIGFSDGLVENRRRSLTEGLDELLVAAAGPRVSLAELLDRILVSLLGASARDDDVTLLGLEFVGSE